MCGGGGGKIKSNAAMKRRWGGEGGNIQALPEKPNVDIGFLFLAFLAFLVF